MIQLCVEEKMGMRTPGSVLSFQGYRVDLMPCRGKKNVCDILSPDFQAGRAYAGMASDILPFQDILVYQEMYGMVTVVHQAHDTDSARFYIQETEHMFRFSKGEPCRTDLGGQLFCFEFFISGHHQQIEAGFLPVAEKQVLADHNAEHRVDLIAGLHVVGAFMIGTLITDPECVKIIICPDFPGQAARAVVRPSFIQFHFFAPF